MTFLKNHKIILFLILFLIFFDIFIFIEIKKNINTKKSSIILEYPIFEYPKESLEFAWIKIPDLKTNYIIKQKFDKEFLNTSYNLYQFFLYVKRIPLYIPYIEEELKKMSLPDDLKYIPIAESALRNDITSSAWRAWIWQIMPETAREYWLIVTNEIDERYHIEKSTIRALKYLKYLYEIFWDWPLVLASYNRWQNAILNALKEQNVDNYFDLYLNEETSRYFFKVIAIKYILKNYESKKDVIDKLIWGKYILPKTKTIKVWEVEDLKNWAKQNNQNYLDIKTLNPWIKKDYLPDWDWEIKILDK